MTLKAELEGTETDPQGNDRVGLSASAQINRSDYEMKFNAALGSGNVVVSDKVKILSTSPRSRPLSARLHGRATRQRTTTSPSAASIAASVSALSSMPEAEALACTCSGRLAPTIAEATFGWRSTQASASWAIVRPAPLGDGPQALDRLEHARLDEPVDEAAHALARRAGV